MRAPVIFSCFLLLACGGEPKEVGQTTKADTAETNMTTPAVVVASGMDSSMAIDPTPKASPAVQATQKPSGVYRFLLPYEGSAKILHTIAFYPGTFRLQEEYPGKKDSTVVIKGTWTPSEGYIWLYKDQVVRGRYTWNGDTLQYYSPRLKKTFSMEKLEPVTVNRVWQTKKKEGAVLYAVGTEPFWSLEFNSHDSVVLNMPDWNAPLRVKLSTANTAADSTVYSTGNDSLQVTVYPLFCSDGMSDFLYTQKVKVLYKGQTFSGCGEKLRHGH